MSRHRAVDLGLVTCRTQGLGLARRESRLELVDESLYEIAWLLCGHWKEIKPNGIDHVGETGKKMKCCLSLARVEVSSARPAEHLSCDDWSLGKYGWCGEFTVVFQMAPRDRV